MHILLVEDEPKLARLLREGLGGAGMEVDLVNNGVDAVEVAGRTGYDCLVLDVALPGLDGYQVCERLRRTDVVTPIIFLTARDAVADRIRGLDAGGDDYCIKPVALDELIARIRSQVRRVERLRSAGPAFGGLSLDTERRCVRHGAETIELSRTEFALLREILERRGAVAPRRDLLAAVWGREPDAAGNVLEVYVGYLRAKLATLGSRASIVTVRGLGYRLDVA